MLIARPACPHITTCDVAEQFFRHGRQSRIVMALKSGLPNEIDWAVHTVYLRSAVSGYGTGHEARIVVKEAGRPPD